MNIVPMNVGYIGLGSMGGALARRLLGSHKLTVWDINSEATAAFAKLGASVVTSAAELALQCDIVFLCLPRSSDVRELIFGSPSLAESLSAGKIIVDQTSGVPGETLDIATQLAGQGIGVIDAPVSGGVSGAVAGTITIMVSGAEDSFQKVLPVLNAISSNVVRCGNRVGDAQAMKLVNNLLSAGARVATLEIVAMGKKMGLPLASMTDVINKGSGRNRTSKVVLPNLSDGKPATSNFTMSMMLKDMNQAVQLGMNCGVPTTITNIVRGLLQIGVSGLGEKAQLEQVTDVIESMAKTRLVDSPDACQSQPNAVSPVVDTKEQRVGYVGLGVMGGALTRRLMLTRKMRVFDVRSETVHAFEADGAVAAADLPSLARECDVIFICVPTSATVREVIFGNGGLAEGLTPGKIIVDQTTGDPTLTRSIAADLRKLGVPLIDAPVSGGSRGAVAGTIAIMCGGPPEIYATVLPILESISPNFVYCGETGNGHVAKLINNAVASCNRLLTYEAASIAVKYGLKLANVATVINSSTGWNGASERILPTLSEGKATADFQLQLMVKDLKLAGGMGRDCGAPMLVANTVCSLFQIGVHKLGGTANLDDMAKLFEIMGDVKFKGA
jgi:3-hydroxyisobutyrate dehydrogenase